MIADRGSGIGDRVLRGAAIAIAVVGVVDPAITTRRSSKPEIAVVTNDSTYTSAAADVAARLRKRFTVIRAPFAGAAATVVVGEDLPAWRESTGAVFVVWPDSELRVAAVSAPTRAPLHNAVPVIATIDRSQRSGSTANVSLRANGVIVDLQQIKFDVASDQRRIAVPLTFVPTATGTAPLEVTATMDGVTRTANLTVEVHDQRWPVLFYDARPSWQSTFVRRALERDHRFDVASRILTSRSVSSDAGQPPPGLGLLTETAQYNAIVVGAPDALGDGDVQGLEAFMRRRGGAVMFLLDQNADGPYRRLVGGRNWTATNASSFFTTGPAAERMMATAFARPESLPPGARSIALDSLKRPVIWRTAVGQGQLIVSGALDSWKYRDPTQYAFDRFWQTLIAGLANASAPQIAVDLSDPLLQPGEKTDITVALRDLVTLDTRETNGARASVGATLHTSSGSEAIRLWPEGVGRFRGTVTAPATPGSYRITVTSDADRGDAALTVAGAVAKPQPGKQVQLEAWAHSRGGFVQPLQQLEELPDRIESVLEPPSRRESWHPMRSGWWIIPFVMLLGAEWWLRRRRGLA